jgi:hypothetical protein
MALDVTLLALFSAKEELDVSSLDPAKPKTSSLKLLKYFLRSMSCHDHIELEA